jgi:hypothetical protein
MIPNLATVGMLIVLIPMDWPRTGGLQTSGHYTMDTRGLAGAVTVTMEKKMQDQ